MASSPLHSPPHDPCRALAGYSLDGKLDTSFGGGGYVYTSFGVWASAADVLIQADGNIVMGGSSSGGFSFARYEADGDLDTTFSGEMGKRDRNRIAEIAGQLGMLFK